MGKQLVLDAYQGKRTETVPWVPHVEVTAHPSFVSMQRDAFVNYPSQERRRDE
jgi:hypothetical protein